MRLSRNFLKRGRAALRRLHFLSFYSCHKIVFLLSCHKFSFARHDEGKRCFLLLFVWQNHFSLIVWQIQFCPSRRGVGSWAPSLAWGSRAMYMTHFLLSSPSIRATKSFFSYRATNSVSPVVMRALFREASICNVRGLSVFARRLSSLSFYSCT